jgi:2-succinyl-5-enolpyruvyl-6-hydroxy-3-cyclohexene-1-carboxylate synthase
MPLDFTNTNLVWTSILAETLSRLGLTTAIVCPGSRSAPLAIAFANHPHIEAFLCWTSDRRPSSHSALLVRAIVRLCWSVPLAPQAQIFIPLSLKLRKAVCPYSF